MNGVDYSSVCSDIIFYHFEFELWLWLAVRD
jgi:hypothetical protein